MKAAFAIIVAVGLVGCDGAEPTPDAPKPRFCPDGCPQGYICGASKSCEIWMKHYTVTIDAASLPSTKLDGSAWDTGAFPDSAPDPYVSIFELGTTTTAMNTTEPRWSAPTGAGYVYSSPFISLQIGVYDADDATADHAASCLVMVSVLNPGPFECSADGVTVHGTVASSP